MGHRDQQLRRFGRSIGTGSPVIVNGECGGHRQGFFALLTRGRVFAKGHRRSTFTEGIYQDDDRVVTDRTGFDGFIDSDLLTQLHDAGAQRVLFAGFVQLINVSAVRGAPR